jgi:hypothetical protein
MADTSLIAGLLLLLANLGLFGLTLKLYTEVFKERSQNARAARSVSSGDDTTEEEK